jgi:hypothetical protein
MTQVRLVLGFLIVAICESVLCGQTAQATDDETAIYRALLRDRVLRWGAVVVRREALWFLGFLEENIGTWQAPPELVKAFLAATKTTGELSSTLVTEPGVTLVRRSEIEGCPLTKADRDAQYARDPRPRVFMSQIGFSGDRQEALVSIATCGGGAVVWLRRGVDGWAQVGFATTWDY